jgi:hypothetical protein
VKALRVSHRAVRGEEGFARGEIGVRSFATHYGDQVRVQAELSRPAYGFLLAFNADGKEQLCWPADAQTPPDRTDRLQFPASSTDGFNLDDEPRGGVQAFVLVASRQPLPAYGEWRKELALPWERLAATQAVVWRGDGQALDAALPGGEDHRGTVSELKGITPLAEVARRLRAADAVEAVAVIAFPVAPKAGE